MKAAILFVLILGAMALGDKHAETAETAEYQWGKDAAFLADRARKRGPIKPWRKRGKYSAAPMARGRFTAAGWRQGR